MNMYIGNLSYNVRESDLRQVMEEYGTVESVKLIMDRNTNRSKGFAFVEMPEAAEAQQAINKLNGAYVCELIEGYVKLRFTHADIEVYESEVEVYARGIEVWQEYSCVSLRGY